MKGRGARTHVNNVQGKFCPSECAREAFDERGETRRAVRARKVEVHLTRGDLYASSECARVCVKSKKN